MKLALGALAAFLGAWLVVNLVGAFIVGAIARAIFPGKDRIGWPMTILLGFVGGIVGKILFAILRWPTGFGMGFVASIVGAFVVLLGYHLYVASKGTAKA